jgi:hypothetical protein
MTGRSSRVLCAAAVVAAAAIGCSHRAPTDTTEALRARVQSYWDLKSKRDVVKMYDFMEQGFRDKTSLADYIGSINRDMKYFSFEINSVERDGDKATVKVSYTYQLPDYVLQGLKPQPRPMLQVPETWKLENGVWNRVFEDPSSSVARGAKMPPSEKAPAPDPAKAAESDPTKPK